MTERTKTVVELEVQLDFETVQTLEVFYDVNCPPEEKLAHRLSWAITKVLEEKMEAEQ